MLPVALATAVLAVGTQAPNAPVTETAALAPRTVCAGQTAYLAPAAVQLRAMRCLINWTRSHGGRSRLRAQDQLNHAATLRAVDIRRCNDFSHTPCGESFASVFLAVHYLAGTAGVGENLAWGQGRLGSARATLANWLASPAHRQVLYTSNWRDLGVTVLKAPVLVGRRNVTLWVANFGYRPVTLPIP
jgi:uncharacterized protein YkwD